MGVTTLVNILRKINSSLLSKSNIVSEDIIVKSCSKEPLTKRRLSSGDHYSFDGFLTSRFNCIQDYSWVTDDEIWQRHNKVHSKL